MKETALHKALKVGAAAAVFAPLLMAAQCSSTDVSTATTQTIQDIQTEIQTICHYQATIATIAAVAATISANVDPAVGATATVLVSVGNRVATNICTEVQAAQSPQGKFGGKKEGEELVVTVNGVQVHGTLTGAKT